MTNPSHVEMLPISSLNAVIANDYHVDNKYWRQHTIQHIRPEHELNWIESQQCNHQADQ